MTMRGRRSGIRALAAATGTAVLLAGCGSGLQDIPLPSAGAGGDTIALTAVFANALNLPSKAKVRLHGADVGEVDSIVAQDFTARVRIRVRSDVALPRGSTAELRSATPLGDVFVQIRPNADRQQPALRDGDTIALPDTASAPTVEELLNSMAMLVNGGAVRALTTDINGAGRALGGRGEKIAELMTETTEFLSRLSARTQQLDATLRSTAEMAAALAARRTSLQESLAAAAPALTAIAESTGKFISLLHNVSRISEQLRRFPSMQGTDLRSSIADINALSATFNDIATDPNLSLDAFNRLLGIMIKSTNSTANHALLEVAKLSLAPLPDKNYPGDPGFHGPDGTDWHLMIGGLRYEWNLLLGKMYGPNR